MDAEAIHPRRQPRPPGSGFLARQTGESRVKAERRGAQRASGAGRGVVQGGLRSPYCCKHRAERNWEIKCPEEVLVGGGPRGVGEHSARPVRLFRIKGQLLDSGAWIGLASVYRELLPTSTR